MDTVYQTVVNSKSLATLAFCTQVPIFSSIYALCKLNFWYQLFYFCSSPKVIIPSIRSFPSTVWNKKLVIIDLQEGESYSHEHPKAWRALLRVNLAQSAPPGGLMIYRIGCEENLRNALAAPIADILNTSFSECKVPCVWKLADVPPLPKAPIICDYNKDLRPISLTSTLSKAAESFVIEKSLKPNVLASIDPGQYGFIPGSSTTSALISMFHHWLGATDGTGSTACKNCSPRFPESVRFGWPSRSGSQTVQPWDQAIYCQLDYWPFTVQTAKGQT